MTEPRNASTVTSTHSFGRYRVTRTLGAGAMGEVYEAIDDVLGREVAIKTLRGASGLTARFIDDRFRNEARAIAQFSHPGVVQVFDIDLTADPPYLVMERVAGPSLSERLKSGPLPPSEVVALGIQIARALVAAHAAGVVHRDVKPSNILGAGAGTWKLADFGVAHVPDSSLTMTGQFVGSPAYAAPEALVKGLSAPSGDVYGLGATLYEAAAGKWPRLEAHGAILAPVPPLRDLAPQLPPHVATAIDRAVSLDATKRPTANELADLLAGVGAPQPTVPAVVAPVAPPPVAAATTRASRWKPWAVGGAIVLLVILLVALRDRTSSPAKQLPMWCQLPDDGHFQVRYPPDLSHKASREWEKVVDKIYDQKVSEALRELAKWEDKHGAREETTCLRAQLERLPRDSREE